MVKAIHVVDENDVWIYIHTKGEARYTDLINAFVDTGKRSKQVLLNYKTSLEHSGKIKKKINAQTKRPVYYIPLKWHDKVEKLKQQRNIYDLAESLNAKWLNPLRNLLIKMKNENPDREIDTYCFSFIGEVPSAFPKSMEAMQSHLSFVQSLRERHSRDLEKYREEYMKAADKVEREKVDTRIRKEVGWTVGEYFKILLKKAEKEEGIRQIMIVFGITDEMLREMGYT